jgi:hypothetical protein
MNESYRRDRALLSQRWFIPPLTKIFSSSMKYDEFNESITDEAADSSETYSAGASSVEIIPSSAQLYF